jgi:hypothetical protein
MQIETWLGGPVPTYRVIQGGGGEEAGEGSYVKEDLGSWSEQRDPRASDS